MKLILAVVSHRAKQPFCEALIAEQIRFTEIGSTGGFLREGNTTLLIGVEDELVARVLDLVEQICRTKDRVVNVAPTLLSHLGTDATSPVTVKVGGATVFVLNVERTATV